MAATVVIVPSVYPPGTVPTIVNQLVVDDGHVVNGVLGTQFGTVTARPVQVVSVPGVQPSGVGSTTSTTGLVTCGDGHLSGYNLGGQFGQVTVAISQKQTVGGVGSAQVFGIVTRISGGVISSSSGVPSAQAFGLPTFAFVVHVPGLDTAQAFGAIWVAFAQTVQVAGVSSAQVFGTTAAGLRAFLVWLHEFNCIDDDLAPASATDLDLVGSVPLDELLVASDCITSTFSICGEAICGDGHLCGGVGYGILPAPSIPLSLQPAGCR